jgi:DNA repair protein RadC
MPLKDLPSDARPREKLLKRGANALSDVELLALLLRTGIKGKGVLQLAQELLELKPNAEGRPGFDGIAGLLNATADDLRGVKGLGPAKRAELVAVLELARRALAQRLQERPALDTPDAVKQYLQLQLSARHHEVFAVLFLDVQNRLLALEELFRGTLTQLSVTLLRKYFGWFRHFTATQSESQLWSRTPSCPWRSTAPAGCGSGVSQGVIEFDAVDISCGPSSDIGE